MKRLEIDVAVFGMVKDLNHKTRAITAGGKEIAIKANRSAYTLVSEIQEEVHRFAIGYHRKLRSKNQNVLKLMEIEGVGEKRAKALIKTFKTVSAIEKADIEALKNAGLPENIAINVYKYFNI